MNLNDILDNEILPSVSKPSRYLGTELNAVHKDPARVQLRITLIFPDLYDLGLGNLGLHILYAILNDLPWCWAERAYAPAPDMERALRERRLPLFAHESKDPLSAMDLLGFTLQSELTYTTALNVLDLAGLPLRTKDRADEHPLVLAGGPGAFNPEPLAPFIDLFVIGDGEQAIIEISETVRDLKQARRREKLEALASLPGVYAPALYPSETLSDGRVLPKTDAPKISRRLVENLDQAAFPTNLIVPFAQQVHDRAAIEVHRGCTHGCRFCQAGMITRPVRERGLDMIDLLMTQALANTGYEEVSLVSLSTSDYSDAQTLVEQAGRRGRDAHAAVSLPSLRLDTFSVDLANRIADMRRTGLTFAPESATPRLRAVINKWIRDDELLDVASNAFAAGWDHVKLYFMIGLPTERDEDIEAIADLCRRVVEQGKAVNPRAKVFTGISTFVPKPFTPFQWAVQIGLDETRRRQELLKKALRKTPGVKFGRHAPEASFIEGLIARGDRRTADLIEAAFRNGVRLDTSTEFLDFQSWIDAMGKTGYNADAALAARGLDERLPWDHIDPLISKAWLQGEWRRAQEGALTSDCRFGPCNLCGVRDRAPEACAVMIERATQRAEPHPEQQAPKTPAESPPVQRIRMRIGRTDKARFLSHLEAATAWIRALRRAGAPMSYSQGFNRHPKVSFAAANPVGEESVGDYMDIVLCKRVAPGDLAKSLIETLPQGFEVFDASEAPLKAASLMSAVRGFAYTLTAADPPEDLAQRIRGLVEAETVFVERSGRPAGKRKSAKKKRIDLRPSIRQLVLRETDEQGRAVIDFTVATIDGTAAKPKEIIGLFGLDPVTTRVLKRETYLEVAEPASRRRFS